MTAGQCIAIAERVIADSLRDPDSARFRHGGCKKSWWESAPLVGMKVAFGWVQTGQVNGKNAYGAYVGYRPYHVLMRDGVAIRYCVIDSEGLCFATEP